MKDYIAGGMVMTCFAVFLSPVYGMGTVYTSAALTVGIAFAAALENK